MIETHSRESKPYRRIQSLRIASVLVGLYILGSIFDLGASPLLLAFSGGLGVVVGARSATGTRTGTRKGYIFFGIQCALYLTAIYLPSLIGSALRGAEVISQESLTLVTVRDSITVLASTYLTFSLSTFAFWRIRSALTFEVLALSVLASAIVRGHRNYHLDAPKELSAIAWSLGLNAQYFLLGLGLFTALAFGFYLSISTARPIFNAPPRVINTGKSGRILALLFPATLFLALLSYAHYINSVYGDNLSRASEGVGTGSEEGKSPLGFHSAVGKTKQPAALVRFEGDYAENPWAPMLYIREGALSAFNGKELVLASREYDTDVPRIQPGEPFIAPELEPGEFRENISYSVYLLAKHSTPIAIDYPKSLRLLRNPDPNRFQLAYRALSIAPKVPLDTLLDRAVGDPNWSAEQKAHYLRAPGSLHSNDQKEDSRYSELSKKLTAGITNPIAKTLAVIEYLSKESIYTRQPGHQTTESGDPVAPYLFAEEKRGYCVHFAHAASYLLRLAGIPARIGTGYLTDLSFAKDGHVLLNMGDRHAWPEIYIEGFGWAAVDVQPARAENEQVVPPDPKLLEELMSKLDPVPALSDEKFADEDSDKQSIEEQLIEKLTDKRLLLGLLAAFVLLYFALKMILRFGYLVVPEKRLQTIGAYRSVASLLTDLGLPRAFGETRAEYLLRATREGLLTTTGLAHATDRAIFSSTSITENPKSLVTSSLSPLKTKRLKRVLAFLNPSSILRWGKW